LQGESEAVNQRWADNTMAKRKRKKGQTMIYKTLHRKLKVEQSEPLYKPRMNSGATGRLACSEVFVLFKL
jgi:hypothetical protein